MHTPVKPIETVEDYEDAMTRVAALSGCLPGTDEEDELRALVQSVEKWEHDHGRMPRAIRPPGA